MDFGAHIFTLYAVKLKKLPRKVWFKCSSQLTVLHIHRHTNKSEIIESYVAPCIPYADIFANVLCSIFLQVNMVEIRLLIYDIILME